MPPSTVASTPSARRAAERALGIQALFKGSVGLKKLLQLILLGGREIGQQFRNQIETNIFELTAKLIMKKAGAKDESPAQKRLFNSTFVGARCGRRERLNAELLDSGLSAVRLEKTVERIELVSERRLPYRIAVAE